MKLTNKYVCVLGGSGLIGKSIVKLLIQDGANVLILDKIIKDKSQKKYNKKNLKYIYFDLEKILKSDDYFNKVFINKKVPDIFINCSYPKTADWKKGDFKNIKFESFKKNIDIQLTANTWINYQAALIMKKKKIKGKIIQIGSIYGKVSQDLELYKRTTIKESFTYPLIKGGMSKFMQQMAVYFAKYNIIINTVSPGGIKNNQDKKFISNYSSRTPLKRMANADEISSLVRFLCTEESSYIVGQDIIIDGGFSKI